MRKMISTAAMALALTLTAPPAFAGGYSTAETDIGTLLDTPEAKAIIDKHLPGFSTNEQVAMARPMTLRAVQQFAPDQIKTEILDAIDADLKALAPK